jgi:hypothetical protein
LYAHQDKSGPQGVGGGSPRSKSRKNEAPIWADGRRGHEPDIRSNTKHSSQFPLTNKKSSNPTVMKIHRTIKFICLLLGVMLFHSISHAQTIITDYTNTFDNDGNTTLYQNNYMYWYSLYQDCYGLGYNLNMTNDPTMDADGNTNVSGSLLCISPFAPRGTIPPGGTAPIPSYGEQNLMSGTFGGGLFDTSVQMSIA